MNWLKALVCFVLINVVVACGDTETASNHLSKAKSYVNESKLDEGIIELKNAIKKEPKNAEARFILGKLYLQQGSAFEAVKELEKAKNLEYTSRKVIPLLARAYLLVKADDDVIELNEQAMQLPDEVKSQYLAYNSLANIRVQDNKSAKKSELLANQLSALTTYSYLASAYILLSENAPEAAKTKVKISLDISPHNPDSIMLLAQINTALGLHSEASENYLKYAELQPKSNVVVLFLADSLLKEQKFLEAEKYADIILSKVPNQPMAHYVKAVTHFEFKAYQAAKTHAETALLSNFNKPYLQLIAGVSSYFLEDFEQSHYYLSSIVQYLTPEHPARKMFAVSQLQLGLVGEITDTLSGFTSTSKEDDRFLSSLSYQLAALGAYQDAKALASQVRETGATPTDAEQKVREGVLKLMLNDPSGIQNLKDALAQSPELLSVELALAYAAIQTGDFDQAFDISEKLKNKYPDKPISYNLLAGIYFKKGELSNAKEVLLKSLTLASSNLFALTGLVSIAQQQKNDEEAKRWSERAVTAFPANVKILRQHYAVFRNEDAFAKIKTLFEANKTDVPYGMLYVQALLDTDNNKEAARVLASYSTSITSPKILWRLKLFTQKKLGNEIKYQWVLEDWLKINPYHIDPVLLLVGQFVHKKKADKALALINKSLVGQHKDNKMLKMMKMQLLLDGRLLSEANAFYTKLESEGFNKQISQGLQGRIYLLERNYAQAIPLLKAYYSNFSTSQNIILLATSLQGDKQSNEAIASLESHLVSNQKDDRARGLLANLYLQAEPDKADKAIAHYEKMLVRLPNNIVVLNNLAWLNIEKGNYIISKEYAEKAYEHAPNNPQVVDTYAMSLFHNNNIKPALKFAKKAYELDHNKDIDIILNYSQTLIANSQFKEAQRAINRAIDANPDQQKRKLRLLAQILENVK